MPDFLARMFRVPAGLRDTALVVPMLLVLIKRAGTDPAPAGLLNCPNVRLPSLRHRLNMPRGVGLGLQLLRPLIARSNLSSQMISSIAMYRLLHSRGLAATWVFGTSRIGDGSPGDYAWLELDGFPLRVWPEDARRSVYAERIRITPSLPDAVGS